MAALMHVLAAWVDEAAHLAVDDGARRTLRLDGAFSWDVLPEVRCIGNADGPCPDAVTGVPQCRACFGPDRPECIFEPACALDPSHCACSFGSVDHVVYLAFHGILPKVGMTQQRRVARRLREQGADAYLVLARVGDRASARRLERDVARAYGLPEWRAHTETLPQLARPVPDDAIAQRAAAWHTRLAGGLAGRLAPEELHRIEHPLPQPLAARPTRRETVGHHEGVWLGAKGPHGVYQEAPRADRLAVGTLPVAALALPDLVGRMVRA